MQRTRLNKVEERDKFETFLAEMDDALDAFVAKAQRTGIVLDYSMDSLDRLEQLIAGTSANSSVEQDIQASARYFGETVRRNYGGKWELEIENPKHIYYGLPVIAGHAPSKVKLCPHQTVRMLVKGKPRGFLREVVDSQLRPRKLNLKPEDLT
jgi:hypothetical protein